jgi:hypothetical protein
MSRISWTRPSRHAASPPALFCNLFTANAIFAATLFAASVLGAWLSPALAAPAAESCEYRIVNWNAAGSDEKWNGGMDGPIAATLIAHAGSHQANVMTLQEVTLSTLQILEAGLPGWNCYPGEFGVDYLAVCVDGVATNINIQPLSDVTPNPNPPLFWGYVQAEYEGVLLTSVHTRNFWDVEHVAELHRDVTTGIIGGDFNFEDPEANPLDPNAALWFQTDLLREPTWRDPDIDMEVKIDHVLTVEEPLLRSGSAEEKAGSNHRIVLAAVTFPPEAPSVSIQMTSGQPVQVDGSCEGTVAFRVRIQDECCVDPNDLALDVVAANPTANATLGPVSIDGIAAISPREVEVTGHVSVSALQSCPAQVVIEASARDCAGNVGDSSIQGTGASALVIDSTPPQVTASQADLFCLWPPNHRYVCFDAGQFSPSITDNCTGSPAWAFNSCTSDQPDNGLGDGDTALDCIFDPDAQGFCARSERAGGLAGGRRYEAAITAIDGCGNLSVSTGIGNIHVPHNESQALMCIAPPVN